MKGARLGFMAAVLVLCWTRADAQTVSIQFHDGLVTINAQNAPVRAILAEWARVGGARIVNGDRVVGNPVTLELTNVPERQALDVLLRGLSGYLAGAREVTSPGTSSLDRIFILPATAPPTAAPVVAGGPRPQQPAVPPPFVFVPGDPEENPPDDVAPNGAQPVSPVQLQQRLREQAARAAAQRQAEPDPEETETPARSTQKPSTTPGGNVKGSGRPGEINPAPAQTPRNPLRPNGDPEP